MVKTGITQRIRRRVSSALLLCLLAAVFTSLTGCTEEDDIAKTIAEFQTSSNTLTSAYTLLLTNSNTIEANNYIDNQAFPASTATFNDGLITSGALARTPLLTPEQIKLRASVIKALADYTTALATLASSQDAAKVQTDFTAAGASLSTLSNDSATAILHPSATTQLFDFGSPIATAVSVIGNVIDLVLRHRAVNEIKRSIFQTDPSLARLYALLAKESTYLYLRQVQNLSLTGTTVLSNYNRARVASNPNPAELLQYTDRLKQWEKDTAALAACDPAPSIAAFKKSHDALVTTILAPKSDKKLSLAELIAQVKSFAADVAPLAQNLQALASAL